MKDPKRYDGPSASTGFGGGNARNRGGGPPPHQSWLQKVLGTGKKVGALVEDQRSHCRPSEIFKLYTNVRQKISTYADILQF